MTRPVREQSDALSRERDRESAPLPRRQAGFSYVEVLVSTVLIALVLTPAIEGLSLGVLGASIHISQAEEDAHLSSLLEETLAQPFLALDAASLAAGSATVPTGYSDPPASPRRRLVFLARYDADDADGDANRFTGGDDGLLWVRVQLENTDRALTTLTAQ